MRYFVTGATGFLGGRLTRLLLARGHRVAALTRNPERARHLRARGVELIEGDLDDTDALRRGMQSADGVFHLAALYEVGLSDRQKAVHANVEGTRHVLEAMAETGVPRGVYTSTLGVFSDTGGEIEDESYRFTGTHLSACDETKWRAHYEVALPMMEQGLPLTIVMPGAVYGPGDTSQMGATFREWLAGRLPAVVRGVGLCWAHVDDIAEAHLLALTRGGPGETYIIAGPCHTLTEAFEIASSVTGRPPPPLEVPAGVAGAAARALAAAGRLSAGAGALAETLRVVSGVTYYGTNEKARRELGYHPRSLERGFADTFPQVGPAPGRSLP